MQETSNYRLAQWDGSDRILREVFNSDNAKVDAAIKAVDARVDAEAAARQTLAGKVGSTQLYSTQTSADASIVDIRLPSIAWSQWTMVYLIVTASSAGSTSMTVYVNDSTSSNDAMGGLQYFPASILLLPLKNSSLRVSGICFGERNPVPFLIPAAFYKELTSIRLLCNSSNVIKAGTRVVLWGVK